MLTNKFKKSSFSSHGHCCVACKINNDIIQVAHSSNHGKTISYSIPEQGVGLFEQLPIWYLLVAVWYLQY